MVNFKIYEVTDNSRIVCKIKGGPVKNQPKAKDFTSALQVLLTNAIEDAGLSDSDNNLHERVLPRISDLYAANYINKQEAFFLLTGIMPAKAVYRFEWKGTVYFTMRPDFVYHCAWSNFCWPPLNCFESEIQDRLLGRKKGINAIRQAIKHGELPNYYNKEAPFEEWMHLFQKRGFDLSHIPQKYLNDPLSVLRKENSVLKANLEQTKKKSHELSAKLQQCEKRLSSAYSDVVSLRSEKTYLNIIGAFLEVTTGTLKDVNFSSETKLREFIAEKFDDLRGVSPRTLADKFALAKKALKGQLD